MRDRNKNKITLLLIRHGMTKANKERRFLGRTDEGLSQEGVDDIKRKWPSAPGCEMVFSSPMKRCLETASLIWNSDADDIKNGLQIVPEWREIDFGLFEYKTHEELKDLSEYQAWMESGGKMKIPEGESREDFAERAYKGLKGVLGKCVEAGADKAAAVVHGGTIMAVLSALNAGDFYEYLCPNGGGYEAEIFYSPDKMELKAIKRIGADE